MAFSGGWRISSRFSVDPQPEIHTVSSVEHAAGDHEDETDINAFVYQAPALYPTAEDIGEYPDLRYLVDTAGVVLDSTSQAHDGTPQGIVSDALGVNSVHNSGEDYGSTHAWEGYRANWSGDEYVGMRWEDPEPMALAGQGNTVLERGMNGNAVNQPEGYRPGWNWNTWVDRKQYVQLNRSHEVRVVTPNIASAGTDTPSVASPYGTPYRNLARGITRSNTPMLRREPPGISESYIDGGDSEDDYGQVPGDEWLVQ